MPESNRHRAWVDRKLPVIPCDEPIFLLRATDPATPGAVAAWLREAVAIGVPRARLQDATLHLVEIIQFQHDYPDRVHIPGTPRSRG